MIKFDLHVISECNGDRGTLKNRSLANVAKNRREGMRWTEGMDRGDGQRGVEQWKLVGKG
jgi:hypothetical protein